MQLTFLKGYPDFIGKRAVFVGFGTGPASYTQVTAATAPAAATGGDTLILPLPNYYIDAVESGTLTVSGTYYVRAVSSGTGARRTWALMWFVTSTNAQVAAAVNLSSESIQIGGHLGQY